MTRSWCWLGCCRGLSIRCTPSSKADSTTEASTLSPWHSTASHWLAFNTWFDFSPLVRWTKHWLIHCCMLGRFTSSGIYYLVSLVALVWRLLNYSLEHALLSTNKTCLQSVYTVCTCRPSLHTRKSVWDRDLELHWQVHATALGFYQLSLCFCKIVVLIYCFFF